MADSENDIALNKWLTGELSDEEFSAIAGSETFLKFKQIIGEVDTWTPANEGFLPDLEVIKSAPKEKMGKQVTMWQNSRMMVAATITLLLIGVVMLWNFDDRVEVVADIGEVEEILLPDGKSVLYLSSGSKASWDEDNWTDEIRELDLDGKGYFDVAKGGAFKVNGAFTAIQVLGTKFEYQEYYDQASIVCYEGTVRVMSQSDTSILVGGEALALAGDNWAVMDMPDAKMPSWIQGLSSFKNDPLLKVIKTLEKEYGLTIDYANINIERKFTGSFPNNDLDLALKIVFTPLQITYKRTDKKLVLSE